MRKTRRPPKKGAGPLSNEAAMRVRPLLFRELASVLNGSGFGSSLCFMPAEHIREMEWPQGPGTQDCLARDRALADY